jgi:hypothetical protein
MQDDTVVTTSSAADGPRYLSQSEGGDWAACGLKAYARWILQHRDGDESPRQQVGSMGHAILADRVTARFRGIEPDAHDACSDEAQRRGWSTGWQAGVPQAADAADLLAREMDLDHAYLLPDLYSDDHLNYVPPRPLAEVRLRVPWNKVSWAFRDGSDVSRGWRDIRACSAVMHRFAGLEGQPDLVCLPDGPGGVVSIDDYKFRQQPDLGAPAQQGGLPLPDRQGAWYLTILRALGLHAPSGFQFRQVNVYAGQWLTIDDFMRPDPGPLVTEHGLPSCDLKRLVGGGGMVTAETWGEAHRLLAQRRLDRRHAEWNQSRKRGRYPELYTADEQAKARKFIDVLRAWRPVDVRVMRADPLVCREVVRDVVVGVEGPLSLALRGVTPARHLQTYNGSPCTRAWGCPLAQPCQSSLGTFGVADALRQAAEDARDAREAARETEAAYA